MIVSLFRGFFKNEPKSPWKRNSIWHSVLFAVSSVAVMHIIFMLLSGKGLLSGNPYNSFAKQAAAWAQGRLDLGQDYPWLELAIFQEKYYVSFPPFPSYVLFPFALIFGENTPDSLLAFLVTLIGAGFAARLARQLGLSDRAAIMLSVFLYTGTGLWQITVDGWVWFFAQNLAFLLTLMAFSYGLDGKKGRSFFFLCAAVGCRPFQVLYIPLLCWILTRNDEHKLRRLLWEKDYRLIPAALLAASFLLLNYLRFGNFLEFGHNFLPEFVRSEQGQFSFSYLPENIKSLFRLPSFDPDTGRLVFPGYNGFHIFLVYPLLLVWLWSTAEKLFRLVKSKERVLQAAFPDLLILSLFMIHLLLLCCHKTMGGAHFGNRYIADAIPAVYLALLFNKAQRPQKQDDAGKHISLQEIVCFFLFSAGLLLNFSGVLQFYLS